MEAGSTIREKVGESFYWHSWWEHKTILSVSFLVLLHNFFPSMLILKNQHVGLLVVSLLAGALFLMFVLWVLIDYLTITCDSAEREFLGR